MLKEPTMQSNNKEAENAVLGAILKGGTESFEQASEWIKNKRAFYYRFNSKIWDAMDHLYKAKDPIDTVTLVDMVKKTVDNYNNDTAYYITTLYEECPFKQNIVSYSKIVWEKFIRREAQRSAQILEKIAADDTKELSVVLHKHAKLADEIDRLQPKRNENIETIVDKTIGSIKSGNTIIPFGLRYLDAPAGGMTKGEITVIGGRPGHGKSTLMINIVRSLVNQEYNVLLFNREMSNSEMMKKFLVMESDNLSYSEVRKGNLTDEMTKELDITGKKINDKYKDLLLMYDDIPTLDEAMIEISRHKPDVVIDDYIQLISMPDKMERRFQIEKIMLDYKWVCKKENCAALLVSQLNRNMESRVDPRPKMSDYAESGVIEQTVEAAMFIFYGYNFNDQEYSKYQSEIISAKTRYGKIGKCDIGFNGNKCKFYASEEEAKRDEPLVLKPKSQPWLQ